MSSHPLRSSKRRGIAYEDIVSAQYEDIHGLYKKYSSEYTWKIQHWDFKHRITPNARSFGLHGIHGCTCTLSISPAESDWDFNVELSDTGGIEVMQIICKISDYFTHRCYDKPIPKVQTYRLGNLNKNDHNHLLANGSNGNLCIVIEMTVVKESDVLYRLNPPAVLPAIAAPNNAAQNTATENNTAPNIAAELKTMFEQKTLCDVTFVLGDTTFKAHKVVLAARSKVFKTMFSSGMKDQKENIVDISNTKAEVFHQFLNYLYSGQVTELEKVVEEMIVIADFYNVSHLKIMCENVMLNSLSEDSVVRYVILADKLNCNALKKKALNFIRNSAAVFEKTLLEEDIATVICLKEILSNNQP